MQVNNIVIVGGGSSGWMTCAALLKLCPWVNVVLVESAKHKPIGVGESTLGHFNKYLDALGLEDKDWMEYCNATYKNSIQFTDFREVGTTFQYPFGTYYLDNTANGIEDWFDLQKRYPEEYNPDNISFSQFYNAENDTLVANNKQWNSDKTPEGYRDWENYNFKTNTAYHLDAEKFGEFLRDRVCYPWAEHDRFTHVIGEVRGMVKDVKKGGSPAASNREIKHLAVRLEEDKRTVGVQGDLFIDCSGFKGALIEGLMNVNFNDFKEILANDKAHFARIPYLDIDQRKEIMHNVTDCTAAQNGWMWTIPLWNRIGVGYAWSSRFAMEHETQQEFQIWIEQKFGIAPDEYEITTIDMKHGYRDKAWDLNCLAIGLSYGFVEPLESTGLLTTHESILRLVDILNRRKGYVTMLERQWYNYCARRELIGFAKFVAMHYALSMRTDNPYWKWCTQRNEYMFEEFDGNIKVNDNFERMGSVLDHAEPLNANMHGMNYIAAGQGLQLGTRYLMGSEENEHMLGVSKESREEYINEVKRFVESDDCPTHYDFLLEHIYGEDDVEYLP